MVTDPGGFLNMLGNSSDHWTRVLQNNVCVLNGDMEEYDRDWEMCVDTLGKQDNLRGTFFLCTEIEGRV